QEQKMFEPIGDQHFRVVIEEEQIISAGLARSLVAQTGEIKGARTANDLHPAARLQAPQVMMRPALGPAVIDQDDLQAPIAAQAQTLQTTVKELLAIFERDNDADPAEGLAGPDG